MVDDVPPADGETAAMKVVTVLGTRPEIIRLSRVIEKLDRLCEHVLVHTGQNFDPILSDVFFDELGVRAPDHYLGVARRDLRRAGRGRSSTGCERGAASRSSPTRLLILGDTNSGLCGVVAKRLGIPVYHMEAGNRCYDDRVPEEVNRRVIDHSSTRAHALHAAQQGEPAARGHRRRAASTSPATRSTRCSSTTTTQIERLRRASSDSGVEPRRLLPRDHAPRRERRRRGAAAAT